MSENIDLFDQLVPGMYCRYLAKKIGVHPAILYNDFVKIMDFERYRKQENKELWDGWFSCSSERIFQRTGLTQDEQANAIKSLKKANVLEVKTSGMPAQRYFRIIME